MTTEYTAVPALDELVRRAAGVSAEEVAAKIAGPTPDLTIGGHAAYTIELPALDIGKDAAGKPIHIITPSDFCNVSLPMPDCWVCGDSDRLQLLVVRQGSEGKLPPCFTVSCGKRPGVPWAGGKSLKAGTKAPPEAVLKDSPWLAFKWFVAFTCQVKACPAVLYVGQVYGAANLTAVFGTPCNHIRGAGTVSTRGEVRSTLNYRAEGMLADHPSSSAAHAAMVVEDASGPMALSGNHIATGIGHQTLRTVKKEFKAEKYRRDPDPYRSTEMFLLETMKKDVDAKGEAWRKHFGFALVCQQVPSLKIALALDITLQLCIWYILNGWGDLIVLDGTGGLVADLKSAAGLPGRKEKKGKGKAKARAQAKPILGLAGVAVVALCLGKL